MSETFVDDLLPIDNSIHPWPLKMSTATDFQRFQNGVSSNLTKINQNTTDLEQLVKKIGTSEDSKQLRDHYLRLQNDTKVLMQRMNTDLKQFQNSIAESDSEQKSRKATIEKLTKHYLAILKRFQEAQKIGIRKEKESLERTRSVAYHSQNTQDGSYGSSPSSPTQYQQQVVLPMEQEADVNAIKERNEQIRQLESDIVQVNQLFKDISNLVRDQDETIGIIAIHVDNAGDNVDDAAKKLEDALASQKAARRKKIILFLILFIILAIIALVLGIHFGTK